MKAVIIAAGCGSRLESKHNGMPKTLLNVGEHTIIDVILGGIAESGINEVVVVTGFQAATLENYLAANAPESLNIQFCRNPSWELSNGISVLSSEKMINRDDEFILVMSDHIFEPSMLKQTIETEIESDQALLALDFKLDKIPDLDDGMKVKCNRIQNEKHKITGLDKNFEDYQAIDCGMFKFNYGFFSVLRSSIEEGNESLSDACNVLAQQGKMLGIDIGSDRWIDLDTPEMLSYHKLIGIITGKSEVYSF